MILVNAPQNEAILSNVTAVGEFRIRNSAKAFSILSSGLYANKIRAIIRELSCNAVDSHIEAGKGTVPFDVHLPNALEPWFSIRDYGTGLTLDQVTNIYTTYFESTKTESNLFTGALGLGSKSPFAYTDNFTVTAIREGKRNIFSAFINEQGVPSVALMMTEESPDPNGVEVKFSVNDRYDFDKFAYEAKIVFTHFKLRPVVSGSRNFKFENPEYIDVGIIPGVNSTGDNRSYAVMGNISYPIDIPRTEDLDGLASLLHCGLVMEFEIGELDFQASREGLSYIPETINAIKRKLVAVNAVLFARLETDVNKITCMWERAKVLRAKVDQALWKSAAVKYLTDTKFPLLNKNSYSWDLATPSFEVGELASKYNISIRGFQKSSYAKGSSNLQTTAHYPDGQRYAQGVTPLQMWTFPVSEGTFFVINDIKTGAFSRTKYHWTTIAQKDSYNNVYVLEKADPKQEMKTKEFFDDMFSPPTKQRMVVSSLNQKERAVSSRTKNVTILQLKRRQDSGNYRRRYRYSDEEMVWRDGPKFDSLDQTKTYYYVPISGYSMVSKSTAFYQDVKTLRREMLNCGIDALNVEFYGVRKGHIKAIAGEKNWINLEDHIQEVLGKLSEKDLATLARQKLDSDPMMCYNASMMKLVTDHASLYVTETLKFKDLSKNNRFEAASFASMMRIYAPKNNLDYVKVEKEVKKDCRTVYEMYPLLKHFTQSDCGPDVAEYINLINASKKEIK